MTEDSKPITREDIYRFLFALLITYLLFFSHISIPLRRLFTNSLFINILGGIAVAVLIELWVLLKNYYSAYRFKNIFGKDANRQFFLVYGLMELSQTFKSDGTPMQWPYFKPETPGLKFGNITPVSAAQLRGAKYVAELFGKNVRTPPILATDIEIKNRLDISYCSIGGSNNLKTMDIVDSEDNTFFEFGGSPLAIIGKSDPTLRFTNDGSYDYGFIIKIHPKSMVNRTWVGIAGLGEWGTSGAAWFLGRNWKELEKNYGNSPFAIVVKVRAGKDESAQMVYQSAKFTNHQNIVL